MANSDTTDIEAVGALKVPHDSYKNKVFSYAKSDLKPQEFQFELGWIVSLKEGKGLGKMLTEILSSNKPNIYATVRKKNEKMRHILEISGFKKSGYSYKSERGDYKNTLYVKNSENSL